MNNKINYVSSNEIVGIKEELQKDDSLFIANLNGSSIHSLKDYLEEINKLFKFPISTSSWDGYLDWIRDLSWLNKDGYVLIIEDYDKFLCNDLKLRKNIIQDFEEIILPFWQTEVEEVVVGGKAKLFMLYLVQ